jgi:hypothetical protein
MNHPVGTRPRTHQVREPETQTAPSPRFANQAGSDPQVQVRPVPSQAPTRPAAHPRVLAEVPNVPTWPQRLLPETVRNALAGLRLYDNPVPQPPSIHLQQTLHFIQHYGNCKSLDFSPTGKVCIRGAQTALVRAGHATETTRDRAVAYMEAALKNAGIHMQFFAWHDLPDTRLDDVRTLLTSASRHARANGE